MIYDEDRRLRLKGNNMASCESIDNNILSVKVHNNVSSVLDEEPTPGLRYVKRQVPSDDPNYPNVEELVLQQLWIVKYPYKREWRDVPIEEETDDNKGN